jgi:hypothetical protein
MCCAFYRRPFGCCEPAEHRFQYAARAAHGMIAKATCTSNRVSLLLLSAWEETPMLNPNSAWKIAEEITDATGEITVQATTTLCKSYDTKEYVLHTITVTMVPAESQIPHEDELGFHPARTRPLNRCLTTKRERGWRRVCRAGIAGLKIRMKPTRY